MRLLEGNRRGNLLSVESGNDFLDMTPKVKQKRKTRTDTLFYILTGTDEGVFKG